MREWTRKNREKVNAQRRVRRAANPELARAKHNTWHKLRSQASFEKDTARKQAWAEANREKVRTASKAYEARVGNYWRHIKHTFGVTREGWIELFEAQGNKCAICSIEDAVTQRFWSLDHCHATGEIRGILCRTCNIMIGAGKDRPETLIAGAKYLKSHQLSSSANL
jgi:hypothetical protein